MKNKIFYLSLIFVTFSIFTYSYCAEPTIVRNLYSALDSIKDWIIKLATPAAAVAVGTGIFITKFSFGDDEKIIKGKKLVRTTIFSYGFIVGIDLILKAVNSLVTKK